MARQPKLPRPVDDSLNLINVELQWMKSWDQTRFDDRAKADLAQLARVVGRGAEKIFRELIFRIEAREGKG